MANDQIEYCGNCPYYEDCPVRKGEIGECKEAVDEA